MITFLSLVAATKSNFESFYYVVAKGEREVLILASILRNITNLYSFSFTNSVFALIAFACLPFL